MLRGVTQRGSRLPFLFSNLSPGHLARSAAGALAPGSKHLRVTLSDVLRFFNAEPSRGAVDPLWRAFKFGDVPDPARNKDGSGTVPVDAVHVTSVKPGRVEIRIQNFHPNLPAVFPPLRSLEAFAHNLPAQFTRFIGREQEMAKVKQELAKHLPAVNKEPVKGKD